MNNLMKYINFNNIFIVFLLTIFIDESPIEIFGTNVRIYQLIAIPLVSIFAFLVIQRKLAIKNSTIDLYIIFWILSYFLSVFHLISITDFLVIVVGQIFLFLIFKVTYHHIVNNNLNVEVYIKYFLISAIFIVILGIIQLLLGILGIEVGLTHGNTIGIPRPTSLMREPDWYGLVGAYIATYFFIKLLSKETIFSRKIDVMIFCSGVIGMVLSMTRAAWGAFIAVMFIYFIMFSTKSQKINILKGVLISMCIMIIVSQGIRISNKNLYNSIVNRVNPIETTKHDKGAFNTRVYSIKIMSDYIKKHPIVGNGSGGMNSISQNKEILKKYNIHGDINAGRGNANLFITSMFDTGFIGTSILIGLLFLYIKELYQSYKKTKNKDILAFLMCYILLLVDFQLNNGIRFGFVWISMALSLARAKTAVSGGKNEILN